MTGRITVYGTELEKVATEDADHELRELSRSSSCLSSFLSLFLSFFIPFPLLFLPSILQPKAMATKTFSWTR